VRGIRARTGVNTNPNAQPDVRMRELNSEPTTPGPREEVYCTKVGAIHPDEMYIVAAHMDGHGWGEAANDDGSAQRSSWNWPASSACGRGNRSLDSIRSLE